MAISLKFVSTTEDLTGKSKWWGAPDLPDGWDYPCSELSPLTFVCQIRCEDIAAYDKEGLLPHTGMLYFFAAIGEYVSSLDIDEQSHNGLGEWSDDAYRVLYSPTCENLSPYKLLFDDGEPAYLEAEKIEFCCVEDNYDSFKLLGRPYYDEISELYPDAVSLLQIDESDDWGLRLYDCGMMCFMIDKASLKSQKWENTKLYFHSF